ncbi:hypothetical protein ACFC00_22385 [Streptomyces adustus]|uniref:hypothetical protein n=1 Tax=Streptomyces adustus TaxID=1609272 RepID=UPI0035D81FBE
MADRTGPPGVGAASGDADGTAVLASNAEEPLKVSLSSVRIVPVGFAPGTRTCTSIRGAQWLGTAQ